MKDITRHSPGLTAEEIENIFLALHLHRTQLEAATGRHAPHLRRLEDRCRDLAELPTDSTEVLPVSLVVVS